MSAGGPGLHETCENEARFEWQTHCMIVCTLCFVVHSGPPFERVHAQMPQQMPFAVVFVGGGFAMVTVSLNLAVCRPGAEAPRLHYVLAAPAGPETASLHGRGEIEARFEWHNTGCDFFGTALCCARRASA